MFVDDAISARTVGEHAVGTPTFGRVALLGALDDAVTADGHFLALDATLFGCLLFGKTQIAFFIAAHETVATNCRTGTRPHVDKPRHRKTEIGGAGMAFGMEEADGINAAFIEMERRVVFFARFGIVLGLNRKTGTFGAMTTAQVNGAHAIDKHPHIIVTAEVELRRLAVVLKIRLNVGRKVEVVRVPLEIAIPAPGEREKCRRVKIISPLRSIGELERQMFFERFVDPRKIAVPHLERGSGNPCVGRLVELGKTVGTELCLDDILFVGIDVFKIRVSMTGHKVVAIRSPNGIVDAPIDRATHGCTRVGTVPAKIPIGHGKLHRIRIIVGILGTDKSVFDRTNGRAPITRHAISVVTFLTGLPHGNPIATNGVTLAADVALENRFSFAERIAPVTGEHISVVTLLADIEGTVAACALDTGFARSGAAITGLCDAQITAPRGFVFTLIAGFGPFELSVSTHCRLRTCRIGDQAFPTGLNDTGDTAGCLVFALVARFVALDYAVTTDTKVTCTTGFGTGIPGLALTIHIASVSGSRVAVVARFVTGDDAVAACARITPRIITNPTGLQLTGRRTAIPRIGVAVFTALHPFDDAVTTHGFATITALRTNISGLDLARDGASVARIGVAIVARLALVEFAVATIFVGIFDGNAGLAEFGTIKSRLDLTRIAASVPRDGVSVVTKFVVGSQTVATIFDAGARTLGGTSVVLIAGIPTVVTCLPMRAIDVIPKPVTAIVRRVTPNAAHARKCTVFDVPLAFVALLARIDDAVAAGHEDACRARRGTTIAFFDTAAVGGTPVAGFGVAVVTCLAVIKRAVATQRLLFGNGRTRRSRGVTGKAFLDTAAVGGTAVAGLGIAVVTCLAVIEHAVTTGRDVIAHARHTRRGTTIPFLDGRTGRSAAVAGLGVAIITDFADLHLSVATFRTDVQRRSHGRVVRTAISKNDTAQRYAPERFFHGFLLANIQGR